MKKLRLNATLLLCAAILAACSGGSTEIVDYSTPTDNTPKLDMNAAIYKGTLPSGYKLTLTVDQNGTNVVGAYTIKDGATIISRGNVSNLTTNFTLESDRSPCSEGMSAKTSNVTTTSADLEISGFGCTSSTTSQAVNLTDVRILKVSPLAEQKLISRGTTGLGERITVELASADDVNFIGSLNISNPSLQTSFSGTIVAKARNFLDDFAVVNINTPANGLLFNVSDYSGNFFTGNFTKITGQLNTFSNSTSGPFNITGITVTPSFIDTPLPSFTVGFPDIQTNQGYTPLFP